MALRINGQDVEVTGSAGTTLLQVIQDQLGLRGTKKSCGRGECGACTVLVDGKPIVSCITFAALTDGEVTTVEGLAESSRDLREMFAEYGGFQCGYCTSGQICHATAILDEMARQPREQSREEMEIFIRHRLSGNICRCTGYNGIVEAVVQTYRQRHGDQPRTLAAAESN